MPGAATYKSTLKHFQILFNMLFYCLLIIYSSSWWGLTVPSLQLNYLEFSLNFYICLHKIKCILIQRSSRSKGVQDSILEQNVCVKMAGQICLSTVWLCLKCISFASKQFPSFQPAVLLLFSLNCYKANSFRYFFVVFSYISCSQELQSSRIFWKAF